MDKCNQGKVQIRLRKQFSFIVVIVVYIRGRDYEAGPLPLLDHLLALPVCAMKPEIGFIRADLYRSGPHVGAMLLQGCTLLVLSRGNLRPFSVRHAPS